MELSQIKVEMDKTIPNWSIKENKLFREIKTKNWSESMGIANMISYLAEKNNHHPELFVAYSKVKIHLSTHDKGGSITSKDIYLAQNIEKLIFLQPN